MRAAIYTRVSKDPRALGRSVSEQEAECRTLCEREGWQVVELFCDNDRSASRYAKRTRSAWTQVRTFIEAGECDVLVTWECSRAQRDLEDYVALRELCRSHEVLWSYSGRTYDLARTDDRFTTGLDALLAERESDLTRDRILRTVRANAAKGRPHGRVPYGFRREYDPTSGTLIRQIVHEEQATVIREAARRFLAGEPLHSIAKDYNARGVPCAQHGSWDLTRVRRLIDNPAVAGLRVHQGQVIGRADWPAILDEADWHRIKARLSDPARRLNHTAGVKYLLSGIARCGVCGSSVRMLTMPRYVALACRAKSCVSRRMDWVDAVVERTIVARLSLPDAAGLFVQRDDGSSDVLVQVADRRTRLDGFIDAAARGELSPAALGRIEATLLAEIETLERQVRRLDVPASVLAMLNDPAATWGRLTVTQRREVVTTLVDVTILPGRPGSHRFDPRTVAVEWKGSAGASPSAPQ